MKWALVLLLILVACAPSPRAPPAIPVPAQQPPEIVTQEEVVSPPKDLPPRQVVSEAEPGTPLEPSGYEIDPYTQLGCETLLTEEEFAAPCGKQATDIVVTYRIGTRNCFVNVKDRASERLTAGVTLTGYKDAETAEAEFDRRLKVLKVGADDSVGERAYTSPVKLADREEMEFLRNEFIVEGGTDTRLCSMDGLLAVMRVVDSRIK